MLGLKIAVTGALFLLLAGSSMAVIGKKMPSIWIALPLIAMFVGGMAAAFGGFLWWVWE